MSAEEEETNVEISIEDQLAPENAKPTKLNKNGKPRKVLSPEALEKLKKLEDKVQKLKSVKKEEVENEEEVKEEKVSKPKGKKKTKIIVEQSSDDSDQFEPNDNVVFVKRITRKKKEISAPEPVKEPELEQELPPPEEPPQRPPTRQLTPQELALKNQYSAMFSGGFMNKRNYY